MLWIQTNNPINKKGYEISKATGIIKGIAVRGGDHNWCTDSSAGVSGCQKCTYQKQLEIKEKKEISMVSVSLSYTRLYQ